MFKINKENFYNFNIKKEVKEVKDKKSALEEIKKKDIYLKSFNDDELLEKIKNDKSLLIEYETSDLEELRRRRNIYNVYLFSKISSEIKDPFVKVYHNSIPNELCDEIINRFNEDDKKRDGATSIGIHRNIKRTKDLMLSRHNDWKDIDDKMYQILNKALNDYIEYLMNNDLNLYCTNINVKEICDKGYNIQKYKQNDGFYIWHTDDFVDYRNQDTRILTYLWYLNDVEEGGETYFKDFKVKPEKGKLLIFPSTWTYLHTGAVPRSSDKYIITGWIAEKHSLEIEEKYNESMKKEIESGEFDKKM